MKKLFIITILLSLLILTACGGDTEDETAVEPSNNETTSSESTEEEETVAEEEVAEAEEATEEEEVVEEEEAAEEEEVVEEEEATEEEEVVEEEETSEEEAVPGGFGDLPMSGTDPETGLEINPENVNPGDTFIVRGTIISMNLTPITSPEFLIQEPNGRKYRIRTQSLDDTYFLDGSQWKPFEYQLGVGGQATVAFDAAASLSDVPVSDDLVLILQE